MKKALRFALSVTMLASISICQIQAPAQCQMAYGSFLAKGCAMPCCKTKIPMPGCPFLKKIPAPLDSITNSVPSLENMLQPLHHGGLIAAPTVRPVAQFVSGLVEMVQLLISGSPPSVRAPPSDAHLLDA